MKDTNIELDKYRLKEGFYGSTDRDGMNGIFLVPYQSYSLRIMSGIGLGWEHVSVSLKHRCPNWKEMCFVKDMFWDKDETVVQFHPAEEYYVNQHPHCLHLWKSMGEDIVLPDPILVGIKTF